MPGEWISSTEDVIRVPEGHCWVEGDNKASSLDSRTFGPVSPLCFPLTQILNVDDPYDTLRDLSHVTLVYKLVWQIPLGLIGGRVTRVVWPPQRLSKIGG